jgi:hypothetical protein
VELVPSIWKYVDEKIQPGVWRSTYNIDNI